MSIMDSSKKLYSIIVEMEPYFHTIGPGIELGIEGGGRDK